MVSAGVWLTMGLIEYGDFRHSVGAVGTCGYQDGGYVATFMQTCTLVTPAMICPSCPMTTSTWASACGAFQELIVAGQYGTVIITPFAGFQYSGGGSMPSPGSAFLLCGPATVPFVIGIPGSARANNIQKTIDWLDKYIIANYEKLTK